MPLGDGWEQDRGVVGFSRKWGRRGSWCVGGLCVSSSEGKGRRADFPLLVVEGEMLESL